jgi:hypothetical protein
MAAEYSKTSPYFTTSKFGNFLDIMSYRSVRKLASDASYTIDRVYKNRPDLLAHDLYGDAGLWWVFAARNPNILKDPVFDFKSGTTIYIPKKETLVADLGL